MIRRATIDDLEMVFRWRNSPEVMEQSTSQQKVTIEEHENWFEHAIAGDFKLLWIIEPDAGTVRVDKEARKASDMWLGYFGVVSIYVLKEFQGQGKGTTSLISACREAFAHWEDVMELQANIREDNLRSQSMFASCGFMLVHEAGQPGHVLMVKHRPQYNPVCCNSPLDRVWGT